VDMKSCWAETSRLWEIVTCDSARSLRREEAAEPPANFSSECDKAQYLALPVTLKYASKHGLRRKALVCCPESFLRLAPSLILPTADGAYRNQPQAQANTMSREQDKEATVYVGNLDERVTDQLVWELMLQAGRIVNVHLPKDRVTQTHQGFGFVEFVSEEDADYAAKIMNQIRLWGKPIRVNKASADKQKTLDVGAELFVGNLDAMVDERVLFETFSRFGSLTSAPKVRRLAISLFFRVANIISGRPR
jgi:hypothetical protein